MAVTVYRSTDGSAPTLAGTAGSLVALLDACLVNGYGAKSAAGWTKPYTSTNAADFRQGTGSNQLYLQIDDNGPGAGTFKEARAVGYETMSAYNTGTNPFPTAAQQTNGLFIRKSNTADGTARPWVVVADARTFYLFILTGDSAGVYLACGFGEFYSVKTVDNYRCFLMARDSENSATVSSGVERADSLSQSIGNLSGHYLARDDQATVGAVAFGKLGDMGVTGLGAPQPHNGIITYTNRPDGNLLYLAPVRVTQASYIRGVMRGWWHFCHPIASVVDGDDFAGDTGTALDGKTFLLLKQGGSGGVYCIETSDTWSSN